MRKIQVNNCTYISCELKSLCHVFFLKWIFECIIKIFNFHWKCRSRVQNQNVVVTYSSVCAATHLLRTFVLQWRHRLHHHHHPGHRRQPSWRPVVPVCRLHNCRRAECGQPTTTEGRRRFAWVAGVRWRTSSIPTPLHDVSIYVVAEISCIAQSQLAGGGDTRCSAIAGKWLNSKFWKIEKMVYLFQKFHENSSTSFQKVENLIPDPDPDFDQSKNLIGSSLSQGLPFTNISQRSDISLHTQTHRPTHTPGITILH